MESPPPYRPKKNNTIVIVLVAVALAGLCCCGVLGGGAFYGFNKVGPLAKCAISVEAMHQAVLDYADANNGKLPDADKWQDQVKSYYAKNLDNDKAKENPFGVIPVEGEWGCEAEDNVSTGIAYNSELSGKKIGDFANRAEVVVLFETRERRRNLNMKYDAKSLGDPPKRMGKPGMFVATLDGHTKMVGANGRKVNIDVKAGN